nr:uncharacterized protein LOC110383007 [Helicoverpa armigera]
MVLQAITAEKAISKLSRKLVIPKLNDTCRKIKCAAIEEPECVKLKRHDLPMDVHIIVVNKCELEYMKCHEGVEAKIVPMKFCSHGKRIGMAHKKKKTDSKSKVNKRVKRRVFRKEALATEARVKLVNRPKYVDAMNKYHGKQLCKTIKIKAKEPTKKVPLKLKNEGSKIIAKDKHNIKDRLTTIKSNGKPHAREAAELDERNKIFNGIGGHAFDLNEDQKDLIIPKLTPDYERLIWPDDPESISKPLPTIPPKRPVTTSFPMLSMESTNYSRGLIAQADKDYDEQNSCPESCPSRDVMVCGLCQHNVYKTFLSVCHMKMFVCAHPEEELKLVSRYPCVLSAPYLSDLGMEAKGRKVEDNDDDKVLRFIICRDRNKLGEIVADVPQCDEYETDSENPEFLKSVIYAAIPEWFAKEEYDTS